MPELKTNAMRALDSAGISYRTYEYDAGDGFTDGVSAAEKLGQPVKKMYKTLVTSGAGGNFYVFVIPVARELDLKAAARAVKDKSVSMIKVADINKVTGYIRGGCSPVGMKKAYRTVIDSSCLSLESMIISAGKIGRQMELSPADLIRFLGCATGEITQK